MANQQFLHLAWEDVLAAANHHLFHTSDNIDITPRIHGCQVARVQPALTIDSRRRLLRHLVIAGHYQETPATEFAAFSPSYHLTRRGINNLYIYMWMGDTHRRGLALTSIFWQRQRN